MAGSEAAVTRGGYTWRVGYAWWLRVVVTRGGNAWWLRVVVMHQLGLQPIEHGLAQSRRHVVQYAGHCAAD